MHYLQIIEISTLKVCHMIENEKPKTDIDERGTHTQTNGQTNCSFFSKTPLFVAFFK